MVRYSFPVRLFHSLLHAGFSRRTGCPDFLLVVYGIWGPPEFFWIRSYFSAFRRMKEGADFE
jgi:hypothetical protein